MTTAMTRDIIKLRTRVHFGGGGVDNTQTNLEEDPEPEDDLTQLRGSS
jgi:hypothetical protein